MIKRLVLLALSCALTLSLGGCFLFYSSDADIVTFVLSGLVAGTLTLDADARTVTATVEPMDISGLVPTVTVSDGAELTTQPALADGQPVTYVVTAENGDTASWTVTVTVQYGISYTQDGTRVVLTSGAVNGGSSGPTTADLGNDVPWVSEYSLGSGAVLVANTTTWDFAVSPYPPDSDWGYVQWQWTTAETGSFDETVATFASGPAGAQSFGAGSGTGGTFDLTVTAYGAIGEDAVGTFSGTIIDLSDDTEHSLTDGFFKVIRIVDGLFG